MIRYIVIYVTLHSHTIFGQMVALEPWVLLEIWWASAEALAHWKHGLWPIPKTLQVTGGTGHTCSGVRQRCHPQFSSACPKPHLSYEKLPD
jgi:hypothetical protein